MSLVSILRELWRRRRIVAAGVALAFIAAVLMSYQVIGFPLRLESRQYDAGLASTELLVDSPSSQVVDLGDGSPETEGTASDIRGLFTRAHLLASLMASSPLKDRIAAAAGISPDRFVVIAPTGDKPAPASPPPASDVNPDDRTTTILDLFVDETLPIITMNVKAPDAVTARRLASVAVSEARTYLESVASARGVPATERLAVAPLGQASSATIVKGPRRLVTVAAFILLVGLWCTATVMVPRLAKTWREGARTDADIELYATIEPLRGPAARGPGEADDPRRRPVLM